MPPPQIEPLIRRTHGAIELLENPETTCATGSTAFCRVIDHDTVHGLIRGRCARMLLDAGDISPPTTSPAGSVWSLSGGNDPAQAARWIEGFLSGSGLLLIHDANFWRSR